MKVNGEIVALFIGKQKGISKTNVPTAHLVEDWGIEGDAHAGKWHRQVSFLSMESIDKIRAGGLNIAPGTFAENITTKAIDTSQLQVGDKIHIGGTELEVTQITKECHNRCLVNYPPEATTSCEGIFAKVLKGGTVQVGDSITVSRAAKKNKTVQMRAILEITDGPSESYSGLDW